MRHLFQPRAYLLFGFLASLSIPALADDAATPTTDSSVTIGAGVMRNPRFPGAHDSETSPIPYLDMTWHNRYFLNNQDGAGIYLRNDDRASISASFEYDFTHRKPGDEPAAATLPEIKRTPRFKLAGAWTPMPFIFSASASQDIGGHHEGVLVKLNADVAAPLGKKLVVIAGPGVTWADRSYRMAFHGITAEQSVASGLPQDAMGAGLEDVHLNTEAIYTINAHWLIDAAFTYARLRGDAATSPLTQQRAQRTGMISLGYKLR